MRPIPAAKNRTIRTVSMIERSLPGFLFFPDRTSFFPSGLSSSGFRSPPDVSALSVNFSLTLCLTNINPQKLCFTFEKYTNVHFPAKGRRSCGPPLENVNPDVRTRSRIAAAFLLLIRHQSHRSLIPKKIAQPVKALLSPSKSSCMEGICSYENIPSI